MKLIGNFINVSSKVAGAFAIISTCVYFYFHYELLPELIPSDFGVSNSPSEFSNKFFLINRLIIASVLYFLLFVFGYSKNIHFYPVKLTENNRNIQHQFSINSLRIITLTIVVFLCANSVYLSEIGLNRSRFHGWIDLFLLYVVNLLVSVVFLVLSFRNKN